MQSIRLVGELIRAIFFLPFAFISNLFCAVDVWNWNPFHFFPRFFLVTFYWVLKNLPFNFAYKSVNLLHFFSSYAQFRAVEKKSKEFAVIDNVISSVAQKWQATTHETTTTKHHSNLFTSKFLLNYFRFMSFFFLCLREWKRNWIRCSFSSDWISDYFGITISYVIIKKINEFIEVNQCACLCWIEMEMI